MGFKEFLKDKNNWIIVLLILLFGAMAFGNIGLSVARFTGMEKAYAPTADYAEAAYRGGGYYPQPSGDFAPEIEDRMITKTASLSTEVERERYQQAENTLRSVVTSSDSLILNENVNTHGQERREYKTGSYQIKVETGKYSSVLQQLKNIGEVQSFSERMDDITGQYQDLSVELEAERSRLQRYQQMYEQATEISDKIELSDRIFNQERTIRYYEEMLENLGQRVTYSTINFRMTEKQSEYANVMFVRFSQLVRTIVGSINSLLQFLFAVAPWVIVIGAGALIVKAVKRKRS
ncbi:DUF4349 domain-containing protein [Candidatus Woesearchaeota archaeon]|nr:DUF4349 domain-containing protein [Candidatus Woesearchaeota archaeon]